MNRPFAANLLVICAVLGAGVAGCLGDEPAPGSAPLRDRPVTESGAVHGLVTDDELRPIADARVSILGTGRATTTDAAGAYSLDSVPAGNATLQAERAGYKARTVAIIVPAGERVEHDVRLVPLPGTGPEQVTTPFQGQYECAWEFLILGGDCFVLYENITGKPDPVTNDTYAFRLPVNAGWESVLMELTWTSDGSNQFDGMRLYLEHGNGSKTGHATSVGYADGSESPVSFLVNRGSPHPNAEYYEGTQRRAQIPDEGEETQIRVYTRGRLHEESCTIGQVVLDACTLGVGAGVDIKFDVYATVFYNAPAPDGFTAVPP